MMPPRWFGDDLPMYRLIRTILELDELSDAENDGDTVILCRDNPFGKDAFSWKGNMDLTDNAAKHTPNCQWRSQKRALRSLTSSGDN